MSGQSCKPVERQREPGTGKLLSDGLALKQATTTIPIVMMYEIMPVDLGLIKSVPHPGGNITGTTAISPELLAKTIQILRELIPQKSHVAMLRDPDFPGISHYVRQIDHVAKSPSHQVALYPS